jgi:uncharacterized lipoprotein YmbA
MKRSMLFVAVLLAGCALGVTADRLFLIRPAACQHEQELVAMSEMVDLALDQAEASAQEAENWQKLAEVADLVYSLDDNLQQESRVIEKVIATNGDIISELERRYAPELLR